MADSIFNTSFIFSYYAKNASIGVSMYDGRPQITAFPRNSDSKKPIIGVSLSLAACQYLSESLLRIIDAPPDTKIPYIHQYTPKDGNGERKPLAVINIFKDDKNRIGMEITNSLSQKSGSVLLRAPASFNAGEKKQEVAQYEYECKALSKFFGEIAPWTPIISQRVKKDDSSGGKSNSSKSRDDDELF